MQWKEIVQGIQHDDYTIFMGDLNYRFDLKTDECINIINEGRLDLLYERDQLKRSQLDQL